MSEKPQSNSKTQCSPKWLNTLNLTWRVFGVLDTTYLCFFRSVEEAKVQDTVSAIFPVNEKLIKYSTINKETGYFTKISKSL